MENQATILWLDLLMGGREDFLNEGEGMIKLFINNGYVQVLVTGNSPEDTRRAARVLQNYYNYDLEGKEVIVTGTLENPRVRVSAQPIDVKPADKFETEESPEPTPETESPSEETCSNGCQVNGNCLPYGTRLVEDTMFCGIEENLKEQQGTEDSCQNNYECLSNQCSDGLCVDLKELSNQLKETNSLLARILAWIERIFS